MSSFKSSFNSSGYRKISKWVPPSDTPLSSNLTQPVVKSNLQKKSLPPLTPSVPLPPRNDLASKLSKLYVSNVPIEKIPEKEDKKPIVYTLPYVSKRCDKKTLFEKSNVNGFFRPVCPATMVFFPSYEIAKNVINYLDENSFIFASFLMEVPVIVTFNSEYVRQIVNDVQFKKSDDKWDGENKSRFCLSFEIDDTYYYPIAIEKSQTNWKYLFNRHSLNNIALSFDDKFEASSFIKTNELVLKNEPTIEQRHSIELLYYLITKSKMVFPLYYPTTIKLIDKLLPLEYNEIYPKLSETYQEWKDNV